MNRDCGADNLIKFTLSLCFSRTRYKVSITLMIHEESKIHETYPLTPFQIEGQEKMPVELLLFYHEVLYDS